MKKFNFAKIVSLVFVCAMLLCALAVTALAEDETTVEIVSNNVYYGEKLQIMYAIKAPEGATMKAVDSEGNEIKVLPFKDKDGNTTTNIGGTDYPMYILKDGVSVQAIDEKITLTVTAGEESVTRTYSVLQYVYERTQALNAKEQTEKVTKELAMLDALVSYADATNAFINGATVSFYDYKYVTVVNGTIDGTVSAGIYLNGTKPFANITTSVVAGENQNIQWAVTDEKGTLLGNYDEESIKDVAVNSHMILTATAIDGEVEAITYSLLTDASMLAPGKTIVIVASDSGFAMSNEQKTNNRGQIAVEKNDGVISVVPADMQIITLEAGTKDGTYALYTGEKGYLYAASSSSNHLKTQNDKDDNASWKITIDADGVASIVAQGTNTHNVMQYNQSSSLFACYGSASQNSVSIYMLTSEMVVCEHTNTVSIPAVEADCTNTGLTAGVKCEDCGNVVTPQTEVAAKGHTEVVVPGKAATCAEDGLTDGTKCSVCGEVFVAQETIPATGEHNDGNGDGLCDVCKADVNSDEVKAAQVLARLQQPPTNVTAAGEIELDKTNNTGYTATIIWSIEGGTNNISTFDGNRLNVALDGIETTIVLQVSVTVGDATITKEYTINVAAAHTCESKCAECGKCTDAACQESVCEDKCEGHGLSNAMLSFADTTPRTSFSTSKQVWKQNGITFTNNKASSTNNVADYAKPIRLYANSEVIVEGAGMKKIVFDCNSSSYATALQTSIGTVSGATVTVSSDKVTITFTSAVDSFTIAKLSAQVRIDSITVNP